MAFAPEYYNSDTLASRQHHHHPLQRTSTMKIVVVGHEKMGKTALVQRLLSSSSSSSSSQDNKVVAPPTTIPHSPIVKTTKPTTTVGLNVHEWSYHEDDDDEGSSLKEAEANAESSSLQMTIWDLTGMQHFHAAQEILFDPNSASTTLYVVVWDMAVHDVPASSSSYDPPVVVPPSMPAKSSFGSGGGGGGGRGCSDCDDAANADATHGDAGRRVSSSMCSAAFKLGYDSDSDSDEDCEMEVYHQEEIRRCKRALEQNMDQHVQFWVDRIQARVPGGATIMPVVTHADAFSIKEGKKRCRSLKDRLLFHEEQKIRHLEEQLKEEASSTFTSKTDTFRNIKLLSNRPKILFEKVKEGDEAELPFMVSSTSSADEDIDAVRKFIFAQAKTNIAIKGSAAKLLQQEDENAVRRTSSMLASTCRHLRREGFQVVQTQYLAEQVNTDCDAPTFQSALRMLSQTGEVCFFGKCGSGDHDHDYQDASSGWNDQQASMAKVGSPPESLKELATFVVLNPKWIVESTSAVLDYGLTNEQDVESLEVLRRRTSFGEQVANCPVILKEDLRAFWKTHVPIMKGWKLVNDVEPKSYLEKVLDFLETILVEHDVLVPLTLTSSLEVDYFFFPCLLWRRELRPTLDRDPKTVLCHGLVFMDIAPPHLAERVMVHLIKKLGSKDVLRRMSATSKSSSNRVFVKEFHCWKDAYRLKMGMVRSGDESKDLTMEVEGRLLQSSGDGCRSMFVTSVEGCQNVKCCKLWNSTRFSLRKALQDAVDELPGIEYNDEAVCPECFLKKPVNEIGTWPFAKIRNVLKDDEDVIRCRHGHCVDTRLVKGLVSCSLDHPASNAPTSAGVFGGSRKVEPVAPVVVPIQPSTVSPDWKPRNERRPSATPPRLPSRPVRDSIPRSISLPDETTPTVSSLEDVRKKQLVHDRIEECETRTKRGFFAKKCSLALNDLGLTEKEVPTQSLYQGQLGVHLQALSLANNRLSTIPPKLVLCLPLLRALDVSNCLLVQLPSRWSLPKLKRLNLSCNLLRDFPGEEMLLGLLQLEELNLSSNKLTKVRLPENPQVLSKLKTLDLSMNDIVSVPSKLNRLQSLKMVDFSNNAMNEIPAELGGAFFPTLKRSGSYGSKLNNRGNTSKTSSKRGHRSRLVVSEGYQSTTSEDEVTTAARSWRDSFKLSVSRVTQSTVPVDDSSDYQSR